MGMNRWYRRKVIGALLAFLSAGLVLLATFFPLFSGDVANGSIRLSMSFTPWGMKSDGIAGANQVGAIPINAYPMVVAAVLLFVGVAFAVVAARTAATPRSRSATTLMLSIAAAFAAATAFTVGLEAVSWSDSFRPTGTGTRVTDSGLGLGFWALIAGAVLAVAAAVVSALPVRQPDLATPAFGIPVMARPPVVAEVPEAT
jgi:hypothetical protein